MLTRIFIIITLFLPLMSCQDVAKVESEPEEVTKEAIKEVAEKTADAKTGFVVVSNGQFLIDGSPYSYVGTNMWYGAYLGSPDKGLGDRERLIKELDLLKSIGVDNLRILGASEQSPLVNSMKPAILSKDESIREDILVGLDFLLAEMQKRDMKAVIFVNNFWEWSGGMATYLSWVNGGEIVDPTDPSKPWPEFALFASKFYSNNEAKGVFNRYLRKLVSRKNTVTGKFYRDDTTIMSWQLANEPRPGDGDVSRDNLEHYYAWIKETTELIKSLAPNQLVSIGSEGTMGCLGLEECVIKSHAETGVDYMTVHMWLKNWGWFDVNNPEETYDSAIQSATNYIQQHQKLAKQLGMPLVLEEFGLERDRGGFAPSDSVTYRNQYFSFVFGEIEDSVSNGSPLVGSNFWAWGGYGKAQHADAEWRDGDTSFLGDPPQEPQGLNSVFQSDTSTLDIISKHAKAVGSSVQ